ncbi:MAG: hypothetical protein Q7J68_04465 [Thermoplasmata archaeon]|nr:hypothetical protein [Thermoplasmata archaeon]
MTERQRVDKVELGIHARAKSVDIFAKEFSCSAAGKVQGNLDAELAEIRGACKVGGDVKATILKVSGSMKVVGNVTSELIRAKGALKIEGAVNANDFRISGATKVIGDITSANEIFVEGVLKCGSGIIANKFNLLGVVDVAKTLKANEFIAQLSGKSSIETLESETISVKIRDNRQKTELLCKKIIGKEIYLEATVAEYVEGDNVVIGPGCAISEVKANQLEVDKDSKVGKKL